MKKYLLTIVLIITVLSVSAQSNRKKGLVFRPEVGVGIFGVGTFENICSINTFVAPFFDMENNNVFLKNEGTLSVSYNIMLNMGGNFNPYFYLGGGAGLYGNGGSTSLALYANPRVYLGNRKVSFFFDLKGGYMFGLGAMHLGNDTYYIKYDIFDTYYYWNGTKFNTTEDYQDFVTVLSNDLRTSGYYFSFGFGIEVNRSSFGMTIDLFNMNLKTTVQEHYWSYADNEVHSNDEVPTVYHNSVKVYDDSNKTGFSVSFKYGYSIF